MAATKHGIDGGIAPAGLTGPITASIGLVTGTGTALTLSGVLQDAQATRMGIDGGVGQGHDNFTGKIQTIGPVIGTGIPLSVINPNDVVLEIGLVTGVGQVLAPTPFEAAVVTSVASNRGTDILAASESLQVNLSNSAGVTGVIANGVACTNVQIITPTEVQCTVPLGIGAAPGSNVGLVIDNGILSLPHTVLFEPPTGMLYTAFTVDFAGLDPDSPFAGDPNFSALVIGDYCIYDGLTTPDSNSVSMDGLGEFTVGGTITQTQVFDYYIYDTSDGTNSPTIEQITVLPGPVEAAVGIIIGTGTAQSVTPLVVTTAQIGLVTGTGTALPVADGSTVTVAIGLVTGVGVPLAVSGGNTQVVSIGLVTGASTLFPVADGSAPVQEIGLVTGTGVLLPVIEAGTIIVPIGIASGLGIPQPVSFPASLDSLSDQIDTLSSDVAALTAALAAQQALIDDLYIRFDLNPAIPQTYRIDGQTITNAEYTLTKFDNLDGTFSINRTATP